MSQLTLVQIPRVLMSLTDGMSSLNVIGRSANEVLANLSKSHPDLYRCICDETGSVRKHIHLFANNQLLVREEYDRQLMQDESISVFQAVSGG